VAQPSSGYQPRNTPAERRAFFDQKRTLGTAIADIYTDPDSFAGTIEVTIDDSTDPDYISNRTGTGNVDGATHMSIRSAGTEIGRITRATSTTAGFLTTSDEDLKENLEPITDDLSLLWMRTLTPYFFNYKGVPDVRHVGYSAQRVAAEWPNGVANGIVAPGHGDIDQRTWDDDGNETTPPEAWQAWMMDHSKLTPILHAAIQTMDNIQVQRTEILDDHEARLDALEQTVQEQLADIAALIDENTHQADQIAQLNTKIDRLRVDTYYTRQMTAYWQYSNTVTPSPGAGQVRTNTALTEMYIHSIDDGGYNRIATLDSVMTFTAVDPKSCRFRVRGATGSVFELRSNGRATKTGVWYTVPITVISGAAVDKGFRVEITLLSGIWSQDPPPLPTPLPT
jgi:uncharacterized coiled-coil protein SlyX